MEVWKIMFLYTWVICRFHVNLPGCKGTFFCKNSPSLNHHFGHGKKKCQSIRDLSSSPTFLWFCWEKTCWLAPHLPQSCSPIRGHDLGEDVSVNPLTKSGHWILLSLKWKSLTKKCNACQRYITNISQATYITKSHKINKLSICKFNKKMRFLFTSVQTCHYSSPFWKDVPPTLILNSFSP